MAYTTAQLVTLYTNANLGKAPDAATTLTLDAYATQTQTGGVSDAAALANTLKLVNNTTAVAVETYQFFTGHAPSAAGLTYLVNSTTNTTDLNDTYYSKFAQENRFINFSINLATGAGEGAAAFATAYTGVSYAQTVASAYDKIIGNATAAAAGVDVAAAVAYLSRAENITYLTNFVKANTGLTAAADIDLAVKAALIGEILNAATVSGIGGYATATTALITDLSDGTLSTDNSAGVNILTAYPAAPVSGKTFVLTTGVDTGSAFVGGSADDTFIAATTTGPTFTVGDSIDGGAGNDTLQITQTGAVTLPVGVTVKNVESVVVLTDNTVTLDTTTFSGVTSLKATSVGGAALTAGAVTDVTVIDSSVSTTTDGGITVTGGKAVAATLTAANATTDADGAAEIVVSGASGTVDLAYTGKYADGADNTMSNIAVTGGSIVTVNVKSGLTAAQTSAQGADATNNTITESAVAVTGSSATTVVKVVQDAAVTEVDSTGTNGKIGVTTGAVTITDANAASTSKAGTINTVTLTNYGASTINSGALTTVNLSGTGGTLGITTGALTTAAVTTLGLNLNAAAGAAVTIDSDITTLNITSATKSSTLADVIATGVTTLNVAGDAALTLTADTFAALTAVTVTNTAGATLGTALGNSVAFTGGAGADSVILGATTKAIVMGDGNDTVTYGGAAGVGGSVAAGNGTDTIVMTAAQAATADNDSTFNSTFSGFEVLSLGASGANTIVLAGINGVNTVNTGGATGALVLDGFSSGGTLKLSANVAGGSYQANVTNALLSTSDVFNIALSKSGVLAAGSITVGGVETININTADVSSSGNTAAIHTATLVATEATTVTVAGNNGLTLTNTGNTKITSFDASGVVANGTADTAANLAVTFASANATVGATVTIKGGAGNDTLTGNVGKDVITGNAGSDIISGGQNQDTVTVGNGHDVVRIASNLDVTAGAFNDSTTAAADIINGFTLTSAITTAADFSSATLFQASTAGGANASLLSLDFTADDAGAGAGTNVVVAIEADATGSGQAAGVTYTVTDGVLTLSGTGASSVDTLGEWLTEAAAVSATNGEVVAFQFGSDTYVFGQNGTQDVLVQLVGVSASHLVLASGATTALAGSVVIGDSL